MNDFRKCHTLDFKNGYAVSRKPSAGIGMTELECNELEKQKYERIMSNPYEGEVQYKSEPNSAKTKPFIPAHVAFDKIVGQSA